MNGKSWLSWLLLECYGDEWLVLYGLNCIVMVIMNGRNALILLVIFGSCLEWNVGISFCMHYLSKSHELLVLTCLICYDLALIMVMFNGMHDGWFFIGSWKNGMNGLTKGGFEGK